MLSVVIETRNDEDALARTLASLVAGAVEGLVREVIVCDRGSVDQTHRVADHAGCEFLANATLAAGIRKAKGDWLMILEPGARLHGDWINAVRVHVAEIARPARFRRSRTGGGRFFARMFAARNPLADGLVINKSRALARSRGGGEARAMLKGISARRLGAEIDVAPPRKT